MLSFPFQDRSLVDFRCLMLGFKEAEVPGVTEFLVRVGFHKMFEVHSMVEKSFRQCC